MTTPTIATVNVHTDAEGIHVQPVWTGVDRAESGGGFLLDRKHAALAERLRRAILAGKVYSNPSVMIDVNSKTFVSADCKVLGRTMNADLRRLGY